MMKLYYSAGSCSTCCHILLEESGLPYQAIELDWDQPNADLAEMERLNPLGTVPVLVTAEGKTLTQNLAILEYVADQVPEKGLLPKPGTYERAQTLSWASYVASDFHKSFSPLYALSRITKSEEGQKDLRAWCVQTIQNHLAYLDRHFDGKTYLMGDTFTAPDAYLFVVAGWCKLAQIDTSPYSHFNHAMARIAERPAVHRVLKAEGLLD